MTPWTKRRKRKREQEFSVDVWEKVMLMIVGLEDILRLSYSCKGMRILFESAIRDRWKRAMASLDTGERYRAIEGFRMPFYRIVSYFHSGMERIRKGCDLGAHIRYADAMGEIEVGRRTDPPASRLEIYARSHMAETMRNGYSIGWINALGYSLSPCMDALCVLCEKSLEGLGMRFGTQVEYVAENTLSCFIDVIDLYLTTYTDPRVSRLLAWVRETLRDMKDWESLIRHSEPMLIRTLLAEYDIWMILVSPITRPCSSLGSSA